MTSIKGKFDDQLIKIQKKREKVEYEEQQYQEDTKKLEEHQQRADYSIKRLGEYVKNHNQTLQEYEELKASFAQVSHKLDEENSNREKAIKLYYDSLNILRQEKRELLSLEDEIDNLKDDLKKFQTDYEALISQKNVLNNKIPELEKEKKAYVASKSFKDASRTSNEIKDVQAKVAELEQEAQELTGKEKSTQEHIRKVLFGYVKMLTFAI